MESMNKLGRILMVEDDPKDVELTLTALEEYNLANEVVVARDGEQALDYLYCRGEYKTRSSDNPAVMLLDLKLPKVDGLEVLKQIASSAESMGRFWFGKSSERVIEGDFHRFIGSKPVGSSGHHSNFVIEAFDRPSRNLSFGAEPVQQ